MDTTIAPSLELLEVLISVLFQWHISHGELLRHILLLGYFGRLLAGGAIASIEAITRKTHSLPARRIPY